MFRLPVCFLTFDFGLFASNLLLIFEPKLVDADAVRLILQNVKDFPEKTRCRGNLLMLKVKVNKDGILVFEGNTSGKIENPVELEKELSRRLKEREEFGVAKHGTDEIIREVILVPGSSIKITDLVGLIGMIKRTGADPILIDWKNSTEDIGYCMCCTRGPCCNFFEVK